MRSLEVFFCPVCLLGRCPNIVTCALRCKTARGRWCVRWAIAPLRTGTGTGTGDGNCALAEEIPGGDYGGKHGAPVHPPVVRF